jgi:hypothetical protein
MKGGNAGLREAIGGNSREKEASSLSSLFQLPPFTRSLVRRTLFRSVLPSSLARSLSTSR